MMRGTKAMRLTLAISSPLFLLLCAVAIHSEETRPWMATQAEFNKLYSARAADKLIVKHECLFAHRGRV